MKQTVYPTQGQGFPPVSFWRLGDALQYVAQLAATQPPGGVSMCPAVRYAAR